MGCDEVHEDDLIIKYKNKIMDVFDLELLTHTLKEKGSTGGWNQLNKAIHD